MQSSHFRTPIENIFSDLLSCEAKKISMSCQFKILKTVKSQKGRNIKMIAKQTKYTA